MKKYLFITVITILSVVIPYKPVYAATIDVDINAQGAINDCVYAGGAADYTNLSDGSDLTYMENTAGSTKWSSYDMDDFNEAHSEISEVSLNGRFKWSAVGTFTIYWGCWIGGTRYFKSQTQGSCDWTDFTMDDPWTTNPATGLPWTQTTLNAAEFGVGLLSGGRPDISEFSMTVTYIPATAPTTDTDNADDITYSGASHNATLNGDITDDGGADVVERGFAWGTTSNTTTPGNETPPASYTSNWSKFDTDFGTGTFDHNIGGLNLCATYYFRAYSRNSQGYDWGEERSFVTLCDPNINSEAATYVEATTARLNSRVILDGGQAADVRFCYGTVDSSSNCTDGDACPSYSCNCSSYNVTTAWVEDTYETGDTPYVDVSGLAAATTYYYCVQIRNDVSCRCGGQQSFTTESGVDEPNTFVGIPYSTSISLSWVKGDGSTNTLIRYKLGSYPLGVGDGTEVYNDSETSTVHTGLTPGTTYYYVAWGESGGVYSSSNATLMITTLAATTGGDDFPVPDEPDSWFQSPDYTTMEWMPFYGIVNFAADQFEMPKATMWYLFALFVSVGFGVFFYAGLGNHNLQLNMIVVGFAMGMFVVMKLIPGWQLIPYGVMCAVGIWLGERR